MSLNLSSALANKNIGIYYRNRGEYNQAYSYFFKAKEFDLAFEALRDFALQKLDENSYEFLPFLEERFRHFIKVKLNQKNKLWLKYFFAILAFYRRDYQISKKLLDKVKDEAIGIRDYRLLPLVCWALAGIYEAERKFNDALAGLSSLNTEFFHHLSPYERAKTCYYIAGILNRLGEWNKAIKEAKIALLFFNPCKYPRERARTLTLIAEAYEGKDQFSTATSYYKNSFALYQQLLDYNEMANILNDLGINSALMGDFKKAIEYYHSSAEIFSKIGDDRGLANTFCNLALTFLSAGDIEKGIELLTISAGALEVLGCPVAAAKARYNLALAYERDKNYERAFNVLRKSFDLLHKNGEYANAVLVMLKQSDILKAMGLFKEAELTLHNILAYCQKNKLPKMRIYCALQLAEALVVSGNISQAIMEIEKAFSKAKEDGVDKMDDVVKELINKLSEWHLRGIKLDEDAIGHLIASIPEIRSFLENY